VEQRVGSRIVAWGCRKDGRVFKSGNNSKTISVEWSEIGEVKAVECGAHHTLVMTTNG
jgi:alpha-tubulin suppressor-like RCC1 family protein